MRELVVKGMEWLGDSIYQRAIVRELAKAYDLYLETPWPQLVSDLPIKCVRSGRYRFQRNSGGAWVRRAPVGAQWLVVRYRSNQGKSMLQAMGESVGVQATTFDLPEFIEPEREPYVVVRPASIRHGWKDDSRSPKPEYIAAAVERLRGHFGRIISVADFGPSTGFGGPDQPMLPLPYADEKYHAGELGVDDLLGLVAGAAAVVGGVGWIVPAAVAYRTPMFLVFGGCGMHNAPSRIFDPVMDTSQIAQAIPDRFCMCGDHDHDCDKTIGNLEDRLERFIRRVTQQPTVLAA